MQDKAIIKHVDVGIRVYILVCLRESKPPEPGMLQHISSGKCRRTLA